MPDDGKGRAKMWVSRHGRGSSALNYVNINNSSSVSAALSSTMDYSNNDDGYPGGSSPWASSPQHNRTSFGQPPTSDLPSSPLPPPASPYGQDSEQYGYMGDNNQQNRPGTASTENGESHPAQQQQQPQQQPSQNAPQLPQHPHAQQQGPQPGQQPQRYHGTRPQRQQQHYKFQAKVTGLERNGKKDPIIRFDVYVCIGCIAAVFRVLIVS